MKKDIKLPSMDQCPVDDIVFIEGKGNYSVVFLKNKKQITIAKTLKKFESQLRMNPFLRAHKSYLVNRENVSGKNFQGNNTLTTILGNEIPISRRKLDLVKKHFA
ncbi:LytR/AlgR family response regulator transcription factor [Aquirufa rosea]|uniref:LytTR family transcriptional regulator n=1 Tax=Aquirufa rosea TaxID=2509241 RepID=A0A4Q1BYL7_9BACT|nr:LytTR family DNA-binding domain-containing protein [Aquirufa rosea]RXK48105.1 LytTR family transcriptional regulator [Aquirufa rosea]